MPGCREIARLPRNHHGMTWWTMDWWKRSTIYRKAPFFSWENGKILWVLVDFPTNPMSFDVIHVIIFQQKLCHVVQCFAIFFHVLAPLKISLAPLRSWYLWQAPQSAVPQGRPQCTSLGGFYLKWMIIMINMINKKGWWWWWLLLLLLHYYYYDDWDDFFSGLILASLQRCSWKCWFTQWKYYMGW